MTDDEIGAPMTYDEIKELARNLLKGRVFMTDCLRDPRDAVLVFPFLALMDPADLKKMQVLGVSHFWEHVGKAMSRTINGMPQFLSLHALTADDHAKVRAEWLKMREAIGEPD